MIEEGSRLADLASEAADPVVCLQIVRTPVFLLDLPLDAGWVLTIVCPRDRCSREEARLATQNLRPTHVSLLVMYPILDKFRGTELADFYVRLRHHHNFETFEQHSDEGAEMETEGERRVELDRSTIEIEEYPRMGFNMVAKNVVDILDTAAKHFDLYTFQLGRVRIRGLLQVPGEGPPVRDVLTNEVLKLEDDQYKFLGRTEQTTVRFAGHRDDPDYGWSIEIGPKFEDEHQVDLRLETHPHYAIHTPQVVEEFLQLSYGFLDQNVVHFVNTFFSE